MTTNIQEFLHSEKRSSLTNQILLQELIDALSKIQPASSGKL
jgi:hypothetical protein